MAGPEQKVDVDGMLKAAEMMATKMSSENHEEALKEVSCLVAAQDKSLLTYCNGCVIRV